jgi:hypothetical protein
MIFYDMSKKEKYGNMTVLGYQALNDDGLHFVEPLS